MKSNDADYDDKHRINDYLKFKTEMKRFGQGKVWFHSRNIELDIAIFNGAFLAREVIFRRPDVVFPES